MTIDNKTVVLLDDNDLTNYYNRDVIEELGWFEDILVFKESVSLLDNIKERINTDKAIPGLFLVDVKMPEMDGFEFLDKLEIIFPTLSKIPKIFILSNSSHKVNYERSRINKLANDYFVKPLLPDTISMKLFS